MCLAHVDLSIINPVVDGPAISRGLKEAAHAVAGQFPAAAARMLIAAGVIDGLLERIPKEPTSSPTIEVSA